VTFRGDEKSRDQRERVRSSVAVKALMTAARNVCVSRGVPALWSYHLAPKCCADVK